VSSTSLNCQRGDAAASQPASATAYLGTEYNTAAAAAARAISISEHLHCVRRCLRRMYNLT